MFSYYFELGLRSLSRHTLVTGLMIVLIAIGVAGSIATFSLLSAVSANPLPSSSSRLFVPQIDNRGKNTVTDNGDPDPALTLRDVNALRAHQEARQTAIYPVYLSANPPDADDAPFAAKGYAVTADFFPMFAVPFQYGASWSREADLAGSNDIVIGRDLNQKLFHGGNSIGRQLGVEGRVYRVAGVLQDWNPLPRYYALATDRPYGSSPQIFLPLQRALDLKIPTAGSTYCALGYQWSGWDDLVRSECSWISLWVELPDPAAVARYRAFLSAYAHEQQVNGRFNWPANTRLRDLEQWLEYMHVVPAEARISFVVALGLLLVCAVNTVGLLLARFMRRAPDIGVRRALGASRGAIYAQYLTEAGVIGLAGGLLGSLLAAGFIKGLDQVFEPKIAQIVHWDAATLGLAMVLSVAVSLLAAAYPVWRASRIQPAWQLKIG